jgi:hypothetical protein
VQKACAYRFHAPESVFWIAARPLSHADTKPTALCMASVIGIALLHVIV